MSLVKICGINSAAAFDAAVEAGADFIGFVFFPASPRFVTAIEAKLLAERHTGGPKRVGLFVDPQMDEVDDILQNVSLDVLQIHSAPDRIGALRERFGRPVWRQLGASTEADFPLQNEVSDGFIVEAKAPEGATRPGGNAVQADWELLSRFKPAKSWLLAGGLNVKNVTQALSITGAQGADVSSGVESAPGKKDPELIKAFVAAVRVSSFSSRIS
ncbi:MAG: phosphoribosylanthranilate isomerase [Rhodospirillales bacterium]|nr:phosphoribosylanthranilate isomerase [Rhodospirillales bacterium]